MGGGGQARPNPPGRLFPGSQIKIQIFVFLCSIYASAARTLQNADDAATAGRQTSGFRRRQRIEQPEGCPSRGGRASPALFAANCPEHKRNRGAASGKAAVSRGSTECAFERRKCRLVYSDRPPVRQRSAESTADLSGFWKGGRFAALCGCTNGRCQTPAGSARAAAVVLCSVARRCVSMGPVVL